MCRRLLLLEVASRLPELGLYALRKTRLYASVLKMWQGLRATSLFYSWNLLLEAGLLPDGKNGTAGNSSSNSSSTGDGRRRAADTTSAEAMNMLDKWVLSQHRSMKLLHGEEIVSFMESHILQQVEDRKRVVYSMKNDTVDTASVAASSTAISKIGNLLGQFDARNLLLMQEQLEKQLVHHHHHQQHEAGPVEPRGRRRLLSSSSGELVDQSGAEDNTIKVYSSIIAATKQYSNVKIGKNAVTDTWLQGPLQWPPR